MQKHAASVLMDPFQSNQMDTDDVWLCRSSEVFFTCLCTSKEYELHFHFTSFVLFKILNEWNTNSHSGLFQSAWFWDCEEDGEKTPNTGTTWTLNLPAFSWMYFIKADECSVWWKRETKGFLIWTWGEWPAFTLLFLLALYCTHYFSLEWNCLECFYFLK